ncbi:Ig-like domain-containing protein [Pelagicoccus sp. SDUM812003]|uniref:rhamnogalacturonan lyase family protein n=1 Tax=Pelagicoccus sp. SDUM812003 TaxID=3041267 RepID=UPI00280CF2D1|nr:Ig-like domain-containing protein [Pelagicoccus sp. SDUM812003]MDQ8204955.1 Ig-like domain-containing protein [Pelagicoccus sp. SDUM812003]
MPNRCPLYRGIATALTLFLAVLTVQAYAQPHQLEYLDRGLVAVKASESEAYLSWRLLVSDDEFVGFNMYRSSDGLPAVKLNSSPIRGTTDYIDASVDFGVSNSYYIRPVENGVELGASRVASIDMDAPVRQYLSLPLQVPEGGVTPDGVNYSYTANDLSVGDLTGDGRYEVVVKWYPTNAKDNAQGGYTGNALLDAYTLDGELLWRIDLGINIRSGAHYTQFMVYDLDGDGISEVAVRTAEGSMDASGAYVAAEDKWFGERPPIDHSADRRNGSGYILEGPEFLTVYNGETGLEAASILYDPQRVPGTYFPTPGQIEAIWGDGYGNRIDRFLGAVAYLDGERPSLVMCRGYYYGRNGSPGRTVLAAYDWRDGVLSKRWVFDTWENPENDSYRGQGAHSLTVGDVDQDGRDEIVYGAATIDDDGTGLYNTLIGHGDALHLSDMDPDRPGLEIWMPHESPSSYGDNGSELHDAATGEVLFGVSGEGSDVGRGVAADLDPRYRGFETWASRGGMHSITGEAIETNGLPSMNFLVWWDADPLRELLSGTEITKWNWNLGHSELLFTDSGIASNNSTKATPNLSADIYGDWREEVIWRSTDSSELRIYSTIIPARSRMVTLMHDRQYRLAIAWQNVGYNQPPHTGFYLGDGMETPERPDYFYNRSNQSPAVELVSPSDGSFFEVGDVASLVAEASDPDGVVEEVEFFENDKYLGLDPTDPYTALWDATMGGSFHLRAVATDDSGAQTLSLPVTVTVGHTEIYDESTALRGWTPIESEHEGYRGDGYFAFSRPWHFIEFRDLDGGLVGGEKTLRIRYSAQRPGVHPCFLIVNGERQMVRLPSTGDWSNWQEFEVKIALEIGPSNTVRLQARGGAIMVDEVSVAGIVRNQAPAVEIVSPQNGFSFPEGVDIGIGVAAQDIGGSVASVDFYAGDLLLGTDITAPYSLDWEDVGEGLYALTATATDDMGAETTSEEVEILVNNPPSVAIVSPSSGSYVPSGETVRIEVEADDGVGTVESVDFYVGGELLSTDLEAPFSLDWSSEEQGPYSFSAVATDNRGAAMESQPIELIVSPAGYAATYQAEEAEGTEIFFESTNPGYNGDGYANFPSDGGALLFDKVDGGSGSMAILRIRYALGAADPRIGRLTVNGSSMDIEFPSTGGWAEYKTMDLAFPFDAGKSNEVLFESTGADLANVDEITVLGLQSEDDQTYHAENAYQENVSFETGNLGFNGTGAINFPGTDGILEFQEVDGGIGGTITLKIRYALGAAGERAGTLTINGNEQPIVFPSTGGWSTYDFIQLNVSLLAGPQNTIRFASIGNDLGNVDEIVLSGITPNDVPEVTLLTPKDKVSEATSIYVVGDSTVASYNSGSYPQKGWGQILQSFLYDGEFVVNNRAIGGRSSRSFIEEGRWESVKAELSEGDYVFVQFGHNDRDWNKAERYTPVPDYKVYIAQYVNEARELGAIPVLVTPMVMNAWRNDSMRNVFTEDGNDYAGAMKEVGVELGVDVIDLNAKSHAFFSGLSYEYNARFFYNTYVEGEYPNFPSGNNDGTHFQEMGAIYMAKFIAEGIREQQDDPEIGPLADALVTQYPVSLKANVDGAGEITMGSEFPAGVTVTLKALSEDGHSFIRWTDGESNEIATTNIYTFEMGREAQSFIAYLDNEEVVAPPAAGVKIGGGVASTGGWKLGDEMLFTAEAFDPDGTIDRVEYYARDTRVKIGEATEPPYAFTWIVEGGIYDVWAEAVDNHGARGASDPYSIAIEVENELPTVSIVAPSNGSTLSAGESFTMEATASDPDGSILRVDFFEGNSLLGSDDTAPYTWDFDGFEPGSYTLGARAIDNFGEGSQIETIAVGVLFPEGGALLQEAEDGMLSGNFVIVEDAEASGGKAVEAIGGGDDWVEFNFNVEVAGFYKIRTLVKAIDGTHDSMFVTIDGDGATTHTWDVERNATYIEDYVKNRRGEDPVIVLLEAGAHTVRFAYRENLFLDLVELELDRVKPSNFAPTVSLVSPVSGDVFAEGETITVSASASDEDGSVSLVEFYADGVKIGEASQAPFSVDWSGATAGEVTLSAVATDNEGATGSSEAVSIGIFFSDGGEPIQEAESGSSEGAVIVVDDASASGGQYIEFADPEGLVSGMTYTITNVGSGMAMEAADSDSAYGGSIYQQTPTGERNQQFVITDLGGGNYSIFALENEENVDAYGGRDATSGTIGTWVANASRYPNQNWTLIEDGDAYRFKTTNRGDYSIGVAGESSDAGADIDWSAESGSDYQRWTITPVSGGGSASESNYVEFKFNVEEDGAYNLWVTYKAIDESSNSSFVSIDGGPAEQYFWEMPVSSEFVGAFVMESGSTEPLEIDLAAGPHTVRFGYSEPVSIDQVELRVDPGLGFKNGGTYQIVNVGNGMALQSESRAVNQGVNAFLDSQQWVIDEVSEDVYSIILKGTTEGLDHYPGDEIGTWTFNSTKSNQLWRIVPVEEGVFKISVLNSPESMVLSPEGLSDADGANVVQAEYIGDARQHWTIEVPGEAEPKTHTIYTIGDSTVANYAPGYYPQTGWGQVLGQFFDPEVEVKNRAVGGTSSRSFYNSFWTPVVEELEAGDFVFIQFGINDRAADEERNTNEEEFKEFLTLYVNETIAAGAHPVLVSTVRRNAWVDSSTMYDAYHEHPVATRELAAEIGVPLIDLNLAAKQLLETLGPDYAGPFVYMNLEAGEYDIGAKADNVHFQEMGAHEMARLVIEGIESLDTDTNVSQLIEWIDPMYEVAVSSNDTALGLVTRTASYPEGATVTVKALPSAGYQFVQWEDGSGNLVSTDRLMIFEMGAEAQSFHAIFEVAPPAEPDPETGIISGATYTLTNVGSGLMLQNSGREVTQGVATGGVEQTFTLTKLENGNYTITAVSNSENLDTYNDNQVGTYTANPGNGNQNWIITLADGGHRIGSQSRTGSVLGVDGDSSADDANVGWATDASSDFQRWTLSEVE